MPSRPLTPGEIALATTIFGDAIAYAKVRIHHRRWFALQPRLVTMAPDGHLWFPPDSPHWCADFSCASLALQSLFLHEMTHVYQTARGGRCWLLLMRHPFCRYAYAIKPGKPFHRYGIEQQAEIVRDAFLLRQGAALRGKPPLAVYEALLPFGRA
jgi:hypothetical protein